MAGTILWKNQGMEQHPAMMISTTARRRWPPEADSGPFFFQRRTIPEREHGAGTTTNGRRATGATRWETAESGNSAWSC